MQNLICVLNLSYYTLKGCFAVKKYVYLFSEGNANMRELLGGKGANLAEMTNIGLPVPQGFTITTEACTRYYEDGREIAPEIEQEIMGSVKQTEQGAYLTLDPERTKAIMASVEEEVAKLENMGKPAIIMTSPIVRMYFKKLTEDYFKDLTVLSYNEVESNVELQSVGMVTI